MLVEIGFTDRDGVEAGDWESLHSFGVDYVNVITTEGRARFEGYDVYVWNEREGFFYAVMDDDSRGDKVLIRPGMNPVHLGTPPDYTGITGSVKFRREA